MTERFWGGEISLGTLGRHQWLVLSSDLCKVPPGINVILRKQRVLLLLPTSPAQWLTCSNKKFPYLPSSVEVYILILWWAAAQVLLLFSGTKQATPWGKLVTLIHFPLKENRTPKTARDLPRLMWRIHSDAWCLRELSSCVCLLTTDLCDLLAGPDAPHQSSC